MRVAIHQPNYIPWIGYFYKMILCDIFIILDDVQYPKNSFVNRNKIKTPTGPQWLTVPVKPSLGTLINAVDITTPGWNEKHIKTLTSFYTKARYFENYADKIFTILQKNFISLSELNIALIRQVVEWLEIKCQFILASQLNSKQASDNKLIELIQQVNGHTYISGAGGKHYQDENKFKHNNIHLKYYNFMPPQYPQLWGEFAPGLSILDLLFNCGPESINYLKNSEF